MKFHKRLPPLLIAVLLFVTEVASAQPPARICGVPLAAGERAPTPALNAVLAGEAAARRTAELARPLSSRGLDNMAAFARLVGVVRHFYPSDVVRTTNWDDFIICGARAIESAETPDELSARLNQMVGTVAPDVRVVPVGRAASAPPTRIGARRAIQSWMHTGIVLDTITAGRTNLYSSVLLTTPVADGRVPAGMPDPAVPWSDALGGGVRASVPIARWVEPPATPSALRQVVAPQTPREIASPNERTTRLAGVIIAWNVLQHSYPYFDRVSVDWHAELRRALASAAREGQPGDYQRTLARMIVPLRDGHGAVARTEPVDTLGVLPVVFDWVERRLVVSHVDSGAQALVRRGEVVRAIDGLDAETALRGQEALISGATAARRRWRAVQNLTLGPRSRIATLVLAGVGDTGTTRTVRLTYELTRTLPPRPAEIAELRPGIMYVDLDRVTDAALAAAMPRLERAAGLVFDMRGYPRRVDQRALVARLTRETIQSAQFDVVLFSRPDRVDASYRGARWTIPPVGPRLTSNTVFLTGPGAMSAAESVMGIVDGHRLADIVGSSTAGTNGDVNPFMVPGGYRVVFTGLRVRKHDGSPHHGVGIQPTVPVERSLRGVADGRDEVLERGLDIVAGRIR